jgi:hypothetical protein
MPIVIHQPFPASGIIDGMKTVLNGSMLPQNYRREWDTHTYSTGTPTSNMTNWQTRHTGVGW